MVLCVCSVARGAGHELQRWVRQAPFGARECHTPSVSQQRSEQALEPPVPLLCPGWKGTGSTPEGPCGCSNPASGFAVLSWAQLCAGQRLCCCARGGVAAPDPAGGRLCSAPEGWLRGYSHPPRAQPWNDSSRKFPLSQGEIKQGIAQGEGLILHSITQTFLFACWFSNLEFQQ